MKKVVNKYSLKRHLLNCSVKLYNDQQINQNNDQQINQNNDQQLNKNNQPLNDQPLNDQPLNNQQLNDQQLNDQQSTNINIQLRIQLVEAEQNKIKEEKEKIEAENKNLELKLKFEKLLMAKCKMHPKTFKSLNNKLISNSMNNNTINSNNITNNNFKIYTIGKENLIDVLTLNEKADIMRSRFSCLERIVEIAHCSKYDQFKNIIITNLKDNHAYKYDETKGYFVCIKKNEVISDLVCERLGDIEEIYEELSTTNKLDSNTKRLIKEFLDKIKDEDTYKDNIDGTTYSSFKSYNEHKVKILIYNNSDKINQDLTIIFDSL